MTTDWNDLARAGHPLPTLEELENAPKYGAAENDDGDQSDKPAPSVEELPEVRAPRDEVAFGEALETVLRRRGELIGSEGALWRYAAERGVWEQLGQEQLSRTLQRFSGQRYISGYRRDEETGQERPNYRRLRLSRSAVRGAVALMRDRLEDPEAFAEQPHAVALSDGAFLVEDGDLVWREHNPAHRLRFAQAWTHEEIVNAEAPLWHAQTVGLCGGDEAAASMLYEWGGLALLGAGTWAQRAVVLVSRGGEGKSAWMQAFESAFPTGTVASVSINQCASEYHRAELVGALLCTMADLPRSTIAPTAAAYWKGFVAGDRTGARHPAGRPFSFRPRSAWLWSCNELPEPEDTSRGFWRRFIIVRCARVAPKDEAKRIPHFERVLQAEQAGILRSLIAGAARALRRGHLAIPASLRSSTDRWRDDVMDSHPLRERAILWLTKQLDSKSVVTAERVTHDVLGAPRKDANQKKKEVGELMASVGWVRRKRQLNGRRRPVYEPGPSWDAEVLSTSGQGGLDL